MVVLQVDVTVDVSTVDLHEGAVMLHIRNSCDLIIAGTEELIYSR